MTPTVLRLTTSLLQTLIDHDECATGGYDTCICCRAAMAELDLLFVKAEKGVGRDDG